MKTPVFLLLIFALLFCSYREQELESKNSSLSLLVLAMLLDACARSVVPLSTLAEGDGINAFVIAASSGKTKIGTMIMKRVPGGIYELSQDGARWPTPLPAGSNIVITGAQFLVDGASVKVNLEH